MAKSKNHVFNSPFLIICVFLVSKPSPSKGLDCNPLFLRGSSTILISLENIFLFNFFFKKLVPLVIEFPFIEFERCFKKLFATLGEKITGIFDVFIFFGLSFLTANSPAFFPHK